MKTRILLADDHAAVRAGIEAVLAKCPDMQLVGEAEDGCAAVRLARELLPDVVLMDLQMPCLNGIDATRQILTAHPWMKVVGLSMNSDGPMIVQMLSAGALGYVLKNRASSQLASAIQAAVQGIRFLTPEAAEAVALSSRCGG